MKKQGYTLAEILICLGIIGMLAAILLPLANKYKPDGIKATYVKTYYTLVETIREIASNQAIYPLTDSNFTYSYNKAPLFNLEEVTIGKDENGNLKKYGGDETKLCEVLSEFFPQSLESEVSCQKGTITYSDTIFSTPSFTTNKGVQFVIGTETDGQTNYQTDIDPTSISGSFSFQKGDIVQIADESGNVSDQPDISLPSYQIQCENENCIDFNIIHFSAISTPEYRFRIENIKGERYFSENSTLE